MLVFNRKSKSAIMIGDDIEIKILSINAGKVKIGITAPASVKVHRKEVWLEIQREKGKQNESL